MSTASDLAAHTEQATVLAEAAARSADLAIRPLEELGDLRAASGLLDSIWSPADGTTAMPLEQLRAMAHAGNYVTGVFFNGELVAVSVAFFSAPPGTSLHSHATGVTSQARGRNVGYALKLHQRAWALSCGLQRITWTFDPVVRRNAHFNLAKLGAWPAQYLVDFYGQASDEINAGQGSDRLLAIWDLTSARAIRALHNPSATGRAPCLERACMGVRADGTSPRIAPQGEIASASYVVVETFPDIEALRRSDPAAALDWRRATRAVLASLVNDGAEFAGFSRAGAYHFERTPR